MSKDPYQILKVHPSAKLEEIKKAYRKLVKIHHPDKGGDSAIMLEVNSAWEILKKRHKDLNLNKVNNSKDYNHNKYNHIVNHKDFTPISFICVYISKNFCGLKEAPPIKKPSTFSISNMFWQLSGFTLPPYKIEVFSEF